MKSALICVLASILLFATAAAEDGENEERQRNHGKPPKVALEACAAAVQGDQCSFEGRRGETLQGSCEAPQDKPLACRPKDGPEVIHLLSRPVKAKQESRSEPRE